MLTTLAISGYRSLRDLVLPLKRLNLITGANGGQGSHFALTFAKAGAKVAVAACSTLVTSATG